MQAANSRIFHLFLTLHQLGVCICLSVCVCECVRVFLLVCRQFVHVWVLKKAGGGVWGEMNLGKMGIQICEKLRENLGWRQIGSCHKWDSKAGYRSIRGPELHAYSAQSVNQDWEPFPDWDRNSKKKKLTTEIKHFSTDEWCWKRFYYLFWPVSQQRISLISISNSWFSPSFLFSLQQIKYLWETCLKKKKRWQWIFGGFEKRVYCKSLISREQKSVVNVQLCVFSTELNWSQLDAAWGSFIQNETLLSLCPSSLCFLLP